MTHMCSRSNNDNVNHLHCQQGYIGIVGTTTHVSHVVVGMTTLMSHISYECVMSHLNESWHTYGVATDMSHISYDCVMSHLNESWHTYGVATDMSHICTQ